MAAQRQQAAAVRSHLEVLVEEPSMREFLQPWLGPWLGAGCTLGVRTFQGKGDLLKSLPQRFAGYARTLRRDSTLKIIVLLDRDDDDCISLKREIETMGKREGLAVRGSRQEPVLLVRLAIRELENWYFGDWSAVRAGFPRISKEPPARYRSNADADQTKTSRAFSELLDSAGATRSKPEWARRIGPHIDPSRNSSASFQAFLTGAQELTREMSPLPRQRRSR